MRQPVDVRPFGGRSFMGAGKKTTFVITDVRLKGRPHAPTHVPRSLIAGCPATRASVLLGEVAALGLSFLPAFKLSLHILHVFVKAHALSRVRWPVRDEKCI